MKLENRCVGDDILAYMYEIFKEQSFKKKAKGLHGTLL